MRIPWNVPGESHGHRWFQLWIAIGLAVAVLLLANSISNYVRVSRRVVVDQLRRQLASDAVAMDQQLQRTGLVETPQLSRLLEQVKKKSGDRIAWIQLRSSGGAVVAHAGLERAPAFTTEYLRSQLRNRKPIFKTLETEAGAVVVEAFPFRLPVAARPALLMVADGGPSQSRQFGILEIAAFLDGAGASLWPLQRSLLINGSAALVLLISLSVIGFRFRSYVEGRQLGRQVEIARGVQQDLLPSVQRASGDFELAANCVPVGGIGGDFYDLFTAPGNKAAFVLGDVAGKGVPAALLTGVIHGAVRSSAWTESARAHEEATRQINQLLCERAARERFASMFWSYFDPESQVLRYVNAGHFPPLLYKADRPNAPLRLEEGGPVLGLLPGATFQQGAVRLEPGDVLVLYSDGIVDASNEADLPFGEERLAGAAQTSLDGTVEEIRDRILRAVDLFTSGTAPDDDRTLLVIRYAGAGLRALAA